MKETISELLNLAKGSTLICVKNSTPLNGLLEGMTYTFLGYDESAIPKNKQNAIMTWYSDSPIWTPEEYEEIRFNFMMVKLHDVSKPVLLKDFRVFVFTE